MGNSIESSAFKVWFVGAGPGDPELLTLKAHKLLAGTSCCIYAGSLISPAIIKLIPEAADKHDSAAMALPEILAVILDARRRGRDVVRLHTGEPAIYGAIGEQMRALDQLGIPYEVVPGISSFQAAAAALKLELTAPEISQTVILTRMAGRTPMPASENLADVSRIGGTVCLFLSADRLRDMAADMIPSRGPDCPAAVVFHASWPDQTVIRGTLADIADKTAAAGINKTALAIIGRALTAGPAALSKLYDPGFSHGCRKGPTPDADRNSGA